MPGLWTAVKQRGKNGQSTGSAMRMCKKLEDKQWKNEELKKLEEALPRLIECGLEKVSRPYKAETGVGCDGFHPKVLLDVTKETRREIVEFLEKVERSGKWPQQACTTMVFLIPKNVTSERPVALMPTLIRWWEAVRAPEVAKWLMYRVDLGRYRWQKRSGPANRVGNSDGDGKS